MNIQKFSYKVRSETSRITSQICMNVPNSSWMEMFPSSGAILRIEKIRIDSLTRTLFFLNFNRYPFWKNPFEFWSEFEPFVFLVCNLLGSFRKFFGVDLLIWSRLIKGLIIIFECFQIRTTVILKK